MAKDTKLKIGCHVSAAGGVFNAPKNAADLGCETFQIFTRPPMGGKAPELTDEIIEKFKEEMEKYYPNKQPLPASPSAKGRSTAVTPSFFRRSDEALAKLDKEGVGGVPAEIRQWYLFSQQNSISPIKRRPNFS